MNDFDLIGLLLAIWSVITSVVTLASIIAALTPTPKDDVIVAKIRRIVGLLALNIGHAKQ